MGRAAKLGLTVAIVAAVSAATARIDGVAFPKPKPARTVTPDELAVEAYNKGIKHRDRGLKAETEGKKADKARQEYEEALKEFRKASELSPSMPQAWNAMGFVQRKLGDYDKALESYDRALQLAPDFPDAIEYRGEALLGLNKIEEAKQAYLRLFALDRRQADLLMEAMTGWVNSRKTSPGAVDPSAVSAFEAWIAERAALSQQTRLMAPDRVPTSW